MSGVSGAADDLFNRFAATPGKDQRCGVCGGRTTVQDTGTCRRCRSGGKEADD